VNVLTRWACGEGAPVATRDGFGGDVLPPHCRDAFTGCSNNKWPVGDTCPLHASSFRDYGHVVALYRSPRAWQRSAFFYFSRPPPPPNTTMVEICDFLSLRSWAGMQTALTNGFDYKGANGSRPRWALDANAACWRLSNFAWVGITDFWATSICLFHARFGGEAAEVDLQNIRPGSSGSGRNSSGGAPPCADAADEQTFTCALGRFLTDIRSHPRCHRLLAADAVGVDMGYATGNAMLADALAG
jgi:hypothetical protein